MTVNNLRKKSISDDVVSLAKTLIKNWKKLLPAGDSYVHVRCSSINISSMFGTCCLKILVSGSVLYITYLFMICCHIGNCV